jgi:signal transduction histidine kinase
MSSLHTEPAPPAFLYEPPPVESTPTTKTNLYFRRLGPRVRIGLCQVPLTVIVIGIVLAAPGVWPGLLNLPWFQLGLAIHAALFLACWLIPWERLPQAAPLIIPVGDILAIAVTRNSGLDILPGLGALAVFPVIWLAASGILGWLAVLMSFVGPLLIVGFPLLAKLPDVTAAELSGTVFLPVALLSVALAVRFATANVALQQRQLMKKDAILRELLKSSKERERLLHTVLDTIDVGVVAVNAEGETILTNHQQNLLHRLALPSGSSGADESALALFGQDQRTVLPEAKRPVRRAVDGESFADYLIWIGQGSDQRALSTAARAMKSDSGEFGGAVIASSDVTGLVEAIAAKDDLIANVSHELRTPLTSILGNLELAQDSGDEVPPRTAYYLDIAHNNAERLLEIVSDLLLSASAALSIHPRRTDIAGLVDSSVGSLSAQARAGGITIRVEVPSPLWAHADPQRISQVIDNLLSNAIKYSPEGGTVTITAQPDGDEVVLSVEDTGSGMTPADASRVFDKFFRARSARESEIPGTGLGLSITKAIVEGHGGTISCSSELGRGTRFTVTLPDHPAPADLPA